MDKVVDHLLVFQGDGVIKDFPGNYTQYRNSLTTTSSPGGERAGVQKGKGSVKTGNKDDNSARLTYKQRKEMEALEATIAALEAEKSELESALCSGTLSVEDLTAKSIRLPILQQELNDAEFRWLELSELGT